MARFYVRRAGRKCRARHILPRHPDDYLRLPKCWACGKRKYTIDPWMTKRDTRAQGCSCTGYNFKGALHRRGSLYCWYRTDGSQRVPGDTDFADRDYRS